MFHFAISFELAEADDYWVLMILHGDYDVAWGSADDFALAAYDMRQAHI